jgi:hypothetical protein
VISVPRESAKREFQPGAKFSGSQIEAASAKDRSHFGKCRYAGKLMLRAVTRRLQALWARSEGRMTSRATRGVERVPGALRATWQGI